MKIVLRLKLYEVILSFHFTFTLVNLVKLFAHLEGNALSLPQSQRAEMTKHFPPVIYLPK